MTEWSPQHDQALHRNSIIALWGVTSTGRRPAAARSGFADDQSTVHISFVHSARKYITASAAGQCHRQVHACKSLSDKR